MKKIIAVFMAITMMMLVAVPAFAAEIKKDDANQYASADVVTTFNENTDWSYTVTIPTGIQVTWNDTETLYDAAYSVTSQLLIGASLNVSVSADNGGKMVNGDWELLYTLTGDGVTTFGPVNNNAKASTVGGTDAKVQVKDFSDKPVGTYTGTLTYTVEYVPPTP